MKKLYIYFLFLFLAIPGKGAAQAGPQEDPLLARARQLYDFVVAGQGDSVYVRLNRDLQTKLAPTLFNDTFRQLETQLGKRVSEGEWKKAKEIGIMIYYCDVKFTRLSLRFLAAFDADGKANTIRFTPVPAPKGADAASAGFDQEKLREREVSIQSGTFVLPGTLTLPKEGSRLPVVILVHGSGPNDRDETIGPNKPFRDLAWGLAAKGVAVIRYDKRTKVYGNSAFPETDGTTLDAEVTDDVLAAVRLAKELPEIDPNRVFVLGHSLGGMMMPRIAERAAEVLGSTTGSDKKQQPLAGVILLAANARTFAAVILDQLTYLSSLSGGVGVGQLRLEEVKSQISNLKKLEKKKKVDPNLALPLGMSISYWRSILAYSQTEVAARLTLPMLILQGERDFQVTMEDFRLWKSRLGSKKNVTFKSYPALNHLLQEGEGKSTPAEYSHTNPVPPYVIDDVAAFISGKQINESESVTVK